MDNMFYDDFFTRVEDAKDFPESLYRKKVSSKPIDERSAFLFEDCFSNHVDYHDFERTVLEYNVDCETRYINQDLLSAYFINKIYEIPEIYDYDKECAVNYKKYLSDIRDTSFTEKSSSKIKLGSNRVRYVVGDVGTGKSAFLKRLICDIQSREASEIKGDRYKIVPVYLNLEDKYNYGIEPIPLRDSFSTDLFYKIQEEVEDQIEEFDRSRIISICPNGDPISAIKRQLSELKDQGIRVLIFVDNLDFYHYYYARYSLFEEYNRNQIRSVHDNIMWLIGLFSNAGSLGHSGLNVIIAARTYIYDEIQCNTRGVNTGIDTTSAITLKIPSEETVVSTRLKLLSDAIEVVGKEKKGTGTNLKEMMLALETGLLSERIKGKSLSFTPIGSIYKLGQHGYRSLVHFLSSLSLSYLDRELLDRFFVRHARSLYILYINNMHRLYSQKQDHFPNMFLVDCTVMDGDGFELAHQPHVHTYWLKYFVLKFIYSHGEVRLGKVLDTFIHVGGYDDHLVRHVIGSLCTANEFRCAEVDTKEYKQPMRKRKIRITERGKEIFSESYGLEFCFQFSYLQSIIDDPWMSYPNKYFFNIWNNKSDFSHLYYVDGEEYVEKTMSEVRSKAKRIVWFLSILEASYQEEIRKRKPELDKILINLNIIPDINSIVTHLIIDAKGISEGVKRTISKDEIESIRNVRFDLKNTSSAKYFFESYFDSDVKVES